MSTSKDFEPLQSRRVSPVVESWCHGPWLDVYTRVIHHDDTPVNSTIFVNAKASKSFECYYLMRVCATQMLSAG